MGNSSEPSTVHIPSLHTGVTMPPPHGANGHANGADASTNGTAPNGISTNGTAASNGRARPAPVEFVGASDHTIGEAVRIALTTAARSLQTLEGVGVRVVPHLARNGATPRFRVTLQIKASPPAERAAPADPTAP